VNDAAAVPCVRLPGAAVLALLPAPCASERSPSPIELLLSAITAAREHGHVIDESAQDLVVRLFRSDGRALVRLARLFVDDRDAAEDLVQEAFLRLARHAGDIQSVDRAPAYLRSIVLNLARDHNRRGLVSLRHHAAEGRDIDVVDDHATELSDRLARDVQHLRVIEAVRRLPVRQRDCIALRYLEECSTEQIAATLGLSVNSVKTHLRRGIEHLARMLAEMPAAPSEGTREHRR
jgi:RNA polymerase sigma factor (sigma-70 family)